MESLCKKAKPLMPEGAQQKHDRFGGRVEANGRHCAVPDCAEAGEFRAPAWTGQRSSWDGPGRYLYFCLDHVREFNAGYDFFAGMDEDEIYEAQHPAGAWRNAGREWPAGADPAPRWADFSDPLDAIGARFRGGIGREAAATNGPALTGAERKALNTLGLDLDADKKAVRRAYSNKLRAFHPDRNGGDRSHEKKLQAVLAAWQTLRISDALD